MTLHQRPWFRFVFRIQGSVIPAIMPRTLICAAFGLLIAIFYSFGLPVSTDILASLIPNIVLGLMLVFRTNTAYERFWEGRKLWGGLNNSIRNLARQIWVAIPAETPQATEDKKQALYLLVAFAVATKLHLRAETVNEELEVLLPRSRYLKLKDMNNPPLEIAFWISDYLQQHYQCDRLSAYQLAAMQDLLNLIVDGLGGCERILKTPIPLAYAIHLKQLLLLYCLSLPFQVVDQSGWWTPLLVGMISFTLFGIEEIGIEIENPFGHDANDLPLDTICATIRRNIEDLMTLTPGSEPIRFSPTEYPDIA